MSTEHFSLKEFTESTTALREGIDNTPPKDIEVQLQFTMAGMERLRAFLGMPIKITSGYRCDALNKLVKGSADSQHKKGEAADFTCPALASPEKVFAYLTPKTRILGIDQLILESTWVHVSFTLTPRYECLIFKDGQYLKAPNT